MGHYCRVCGRVRANEKFSGKGHSKHICRDCAKKQVRVKKKVEMEFLNPTQLSAASQKVEEDNLMLRAFLKGQLPKEVDRVENESEQF